MTSIFLSYRRNDAAGHSGRLYDRLIAKFGSERVFRDLETIEPGLDFGDVVEKALRDCGVLLVVMGQGWLSAKDGKGRRRLDLENDWVRLEVATALARNVRVIPVLVEDAVMPGGDELPADLRPLARRNAIELSDERWDYDCGRLMDGIERALGLASPAQPPPAERPRAAAPAPPAGAKANPVRASAKEPAAPSDASLQHLGAAQPIAAQELLGLWRVDIGGHIPTQMTIHFGVDGACNGAQQVMGMNVPFGGAWSFDASLRWIQVQAMALFQPANFGVRLSNRTSDGFQGTDQNNIGYVFHRASG